MSNRFAEMGGIPVNDDGGEQVEPGHEVVLSFACAVAEFALAPDAERVLERVMSLAPVHAVQLPCKSAQAVRGPVGASVIYDDDLDIFETLLARSLVPRRRPLPPVQFSSQLF